MVDLPRQRASGLLVQLCKRADSARMHGGKCVLHQSRIAKSSCFILSLLPRDEMILYTDCCNAVPIIAIVLYSVFFTARLEPCSEVWRQLPQHRGEYPCWRAVPQLRHASSLRRPAGGRPHASTCMSRLVLCGSDTADSPSLHRQVHIPS